MRPSSHSLPGQNLDSFLRQSTAVLSGGRISRAPWRNAAGLMAATAAKVAAQVAPNIVTGGIVAEAGPPPDFSHWTVEDDILLKNSVEVKRQSTCKRSSDAVPRLRLSHGLVN